MSPRDADAPETGSVFNSLSFRVAVFLTLALLPLGLLAVLQTRDLTREVQSRSELSLMALTDLAASSERQIIERGLGAAEALGSVLRMIRSSPQACGNYLREYLASTRRFTYVGFVPTDGMVRCASRNQFVDFSQDPLFQRLVEAPRQIVAPLEGNLSDGNPAIIVFSPVMEQDELLGFTVLSVLVDRLRRLEDFGDQSRPLGLLTFNSDGRVLTVESPEAAGLDEVPVNRNIALLATPVPGTFFDLNQYGEERLYVHTEIVPGTAYALGVWKVEDQVNAPFGFTFPTALFPLLMWVASLAVAIFAVHRLAVRHLKRLGTEMRRFAVDRKIEDQILDRSRPAEMQQLEESFLSMAYALLGDEARMEHALREKSVLLKEVHHRVKNNLQMISSIMNMKIRKAQSPETKAALRRLQERVLSLATVHRNLYQTDDVTRSNAGELLREIFSQLISAKRAQASTRLNVAMDFDPVIMFPDQAVPFALLASEIAMNALNFAGSLDGEEPWVKFALKAEGPDRVRLECRNSIGAHARPPDAGDEFGLGSQLIKAFSMQLNATLDVQETDRDYLVAVTFTVQDFRPETLDY